MSEKLLSVGLDVGTTTTQLVLSELTAENKASSFAVPQMQITNRKILYRSPVYFTPLRTGDLVDETAIREIVTREYAAAGIDRAQVDTGAIIITGETSRRENARAVLAALSDFAGDFVVATAGPELESVLAAKGAGAVEASQKSSRPVLHMDIGGGTSNLALLEDGNILQTGCLNVGGRLLKLDDAGYITYVSPVLKGHCGLKPGDRADPAELNRVAGMLTQVLEMAAGLREKTALLDAFLTKEVSIPWKIPEKRPVLSFSGGVADCIETQKQMLAYGDLGPLLGQAIAGSRLCEKEYMLGKETIRATVIGAGSHTTQLSGSTVFHRGVALPVKNLPVAVFTQKEQLSDALPELIRQKMALLDREQMVLAFPGFVSAQNGQLRRLAQQILRGVEDKPVFVCLEADMAKALGHKLCLLGPEKPCLCIDSIRLTEESFLDIGQPVGPCLPVVIKTLVLSPGKS